MIKVGIIGYGYMGEIRHRAAAKHPNLSIDYICDVGPVDLVCPAPNAKIVDNYQEVIDSDVDLVFVCPPNNLIPHITIECLKRGKHVFAEKPPGRNLQDIVDMRNQEELSPNSKLMFGFNHRYHPGVLRALDIVKSERYGKVLWVRGIYGKSGGTQFRDSWRNKKEISGGGILLDQGIHMLDLFNLFCGDFEQVKSFTENSYWGFELEDNAFVILKNDQGQSAMLHSSATLWKHKFKMELGLERGYLIIEGLLSKSGSYGRETLVVGRQQFEDEASAVGNPSEEITYFDKDLSWEIEMNNLIDCIQQDKPVTKSSSLDALKAMRIVDCAYKNSLKEK